MYQCENIESGSTKRADMYIYFDFLLEVVSWTCVSKPYLNVAQGQHPSKQIQDREEVQKQLLSFLIILSIRNGKSMQILITETILKSLHIGSITVTRTAPGVCRTTLGMVKSYAKKNRNDLWTAIQKSRHYEDIMKKQELLHWFEKNHILPASPHGGLLSRTSSSHFLSVQPNAIHSVAVPHPPATHMLTMLHFVLILEQTAEKTASRTESFRLRRFNGFYSFLIQEPRNLTVWYFLVCVLQKCLIV